MTDEVGAHNEIIISEAALWSPALQTVLVQGGWFRV